MVTLNRSAIVVKPKQRFLDWLHTADPTSRSLTLQELVREPAIYLIPECDTNAEVDEVLRELCDEIFIEQLEGWFNDSDLASGSWLRGLLQVVRLPAPFDVGGSLRPTPGSRIRLITITCGALADKT
jgi:hypothetical protein